MILTDVVARWPGSVHDARVLRESAIFEACEGPNTLSRLHFSGL